MKFLKKFGIGKQISSTLDPNTSTPLSGNLDLPADHSTDDIAEVEFPEFDATAFADWANPLAEKLTPVGLGNLLIKLGYSPTSDLGTLWMEMTDIMVGVGLRMWLCTIALQP